MRVGGHVASQPPPSYLSTEVERSPLTRRRSIQRPCRQGLRRAQLRRRHPGLRVARAVKPNGADVFVQHLSLGANQVFAWHTHPGPVIVTVRSGSLIYQDAAQHVPRSGVLGRSGIRGSRFRPRAPRDRGRAGAEIYSTFLLPPVGEPPDRGLGPGDVRSRTTPKSCDGSRESGSHRETLSRVVRTAS